jgi:hypothetical protein
VHTELQVAGCNFIMVSFIIYTQQNTRMVKSRRMRETGHLSLVGGMRNLFIGLKGRWGSKRQQKSRIRWAYGTKLILATLFIAGCVINELFTVEHCCCMNDTEKPKYWEEKLSHLLCQIKISHGLAWD